MVDPSAAATDIHASPSGSSAAASPGRRARRRDVSTAKEFCDALEQSRRWGLARRRRPRPLGRPPRRRPAAARPRGAAAPQPGEGQEPVPGRWAGRASAARASFWSGWRSWASGWPAASTASSPTSRAWCTRFGKLDRVTTPGPELSSAGADRGGREAAGDPRQPDRDRLPLAGQPTGGADAAPRATSATRR